MTKTITLFNGMIAEYKEIDQAFILKAEWSGQVTEFALVTEPDDEVVGEVIKSEAKKKKVAAPLRPWLLSVITFGLIGLFLGALIPNKKRPIAKA